MHNNVPNSTLKRKFSDRIKNILQDSLSPIKNETYINKNSALGYNRRLTADILKKNQAQQKNTDVASYFSDIDVPKTFNVPGGTNQFILYNNTYDKIENSISNGQNEETHACSSTFKERNDEINVNIKLENEIKTFIRQNSSEGTQINQLIYSHENKEVKKTLSNNLLTLGNRVNQNFMNISQKEQKSDYLLRKGNESYTVSVREIVEVVEEVSIIEVPEHLLKDEYVVQNEIINQSKIYNYSTSYENNGNLRKLSNLQISEKKKNTFNNKANETFIVDQDMKNNETGAQITQMFDAKNTNLFVNTPVKNSEKQSFVDLTIRKDSRDNFSELMKGISVPHNEIKETIGSEKRIVKCSDIQSDGNSYLEKKMEDPIVVKSNNFTTLGKKICENFRKKFVINQESLKKINDQKLFEKGLQILINKYSKLDKVRRMRKEGKLEDDHLVGTGLFQFQNHKKRCFPEWKKNYMPLDKWIQTIRNKMALNSECKHKEEEGKNISLTNTISKNRQKKSMDKQEGGVILRSKRVLLKKKRKLGKSKKFTAKKKEEKNCKTILKRRKK